MRDIYISMLSFPKQEIESFGQSSYIEHIVGMGATGVGVHRELLLNEKEIFILQEKIEKYKLKVAYCINDFLFNETGKLNNNISNYIEEAKQLNASILKMSLGQFHLEKFDWLELKEQFHSDENIQLIIQNDCSDYGGNLSVIKSFITECYRNNLNVQVGFDCGNWTYMNEDVEFALNELNGYIGLTHLKRLVSNGEIVITVPINNEKEAKWKKVLDGVLDSPVCIDFSLHSSEEGKYYVDLIQSYLKKVVHI